jgi:isoquinoline 1-oxidoreductase alpha subunit
VELHVNGVRRAVDVPDDVPLLWVLREELGLTAAKYGCGAGLCGACTVHLGGEAVRSCVVPAGSVGSREVTTAEGLRGELADRVRRAWIESQVPQCGYCQPGFVMAAIALLREHPNPDEATLRARLTNLCRCGTYARVLRAVRAASGAAAAPTAAQP